MGLNQEGKASASVAALQKMMVVKAKVRRDGDARRGRRWRSSSRATSSTSRPATSSRPTAGSSRAATLEIDESALTGESAPGAQADSTPVAADSALGDRVDLAFMNTQVTRGAGTIVVTGDRHVDRGRPHQRHAPGDDGRGDAAHPAAEHADEPDPRHRRRRAGRSRSASGSVRGTRRSTTLFLTAIAFSVSAIPTGLPAVVTAILVVGHPEARRGRRDREAAALGRDARLDVGDQLRQDRDADAQPDDRGPDGDRRPALRDLRRGLLHRRPDHPRRRPGGRPARRAAAADGPLRRRRGQRRQPRRRPDRGRARRPRREGRRRPDAHPRAATRASRRSRSTRRTSSWPRSTG